MTLLEIFLIGNDDNSGFFQHVIDKNVKSIQL